jgi:hypothetical protein
VTDTRSENGSSSSGRAGQEPDESGTFDRPDEPVPCIRARGQGRQLHVSAGLGAQQESVSERDSESEKDSQDEENTNRISPKRGEIKGFSEGSQRRLRERVHAVRRDAKGVFVTLTYHEACPTPDRAKQDVETLWKWLERRYNGDQVQPISCVWKLEPQERGVPHFHLIIWGIDYIPVQKLCEKWHEITRETSDQHRKQGVDIETAVNEDGKLQSYLAKYMAEDYDQWPGVRPGEPWAKPGRWWGFMARDHVPVAEWEDARVHITASQAFDLIDELLDEWDVDIPEGVTPPSLLVNCHGDPGERLLDLIDRIPEQE